RAGEASARPARALALAFGGVVFLLVVGRLAWRLPVPFPPILLFIWLVMVLGAAIAWVGWPALARTLLAYGLVSRLVVAVVMLLAMRGNWGTHYDYVGMPPAFQMPFWPRFLWLAFFPQLVFWVAFTVLLGMLAGSLYAVLFLRPPVYPTSARRRRVQSRSASSSFLTYARVASSVRRPSLSNFSWARVTSTSGERRAWVPVKRKACRSWSWARTVPWAPMVAPMIAAGLPRSGVLSGGREAQSMAFFSTPGTP